MPPILIYLLRLSISLGVVWLFYQLLLRRLTFYGMNRWYLLGYSVLSFFIPLINIYPILREEGPAGEPYLIRFIPVVGGQEHEVTAEVHGGISWWVWLIGFFVLGALVLLIRLLIRGLSLYRLRQSARLIGGTALKIYQVDASIIPFSFGHSIYINQYLHTEKEWSDIILHEYVHIKQRHTVDILLAELICILNWYNPFCWLMRWSIRQNLEFIADQQVLSNGVDRAGYQYHLLKVLGESRYRLANNFNFSSLKKRIIMMNKMRSARLHLLKFLFVLPLVGVLLVAFRDKYTGLWSPSAGGVYVNAVGIVISLPNKAPLAGVVVQDKATGLKTTTDERGYYKLKIPAASDSVRIHLDYTKEGYESDYRERLFATPKEAVGVMDVGTLHQMSAARTGFFIAPGFRRIPANPGYADAKTELERVLNENVQIAHLMHMQKEHPEVSLFYVTEDKQRRIVFHTDGTVEKYGYPGGASLADMDQKYGTLPDYMRANDPQVNTGYLTRWAEISAEAEKTFRPAGGDARAIVFPGDSRVVVVSADGKTRVYDMDNDAEKERAAFESTYGKLPACVPAAGFNSDEMEGKTRSKGLVSAAGTRSAAADTQRKDTVPVFGGAVQLLPPDILYVVDGEKMPEGWTPDKLPAASIGSRVYIDISKALTYFGPRGVHGAVVIRTKTYEDAHPFMVIGDDKRGNPAVVFGDSVLGRRVPLWVVDGHVWSNDSMQMLNPNSIESMSVYKPGTPHTMQYGDAGKNGVIEITLKPKGTSAVQNGLPSVAVNAVDEKPLSVMSVIVNNGHQSVKLVGEGVTVVADTIKMKNVTISGYHPDGN